MTTVKETHRTDADFAREQQVQQQPGPDLVVELTPDSSVMDLLRRGVPLSLLVDLSLPDGPDSEEILAAERWQGEGSWLDRP
jgi:hypothetical protein